MTTRGQDLAAVIKRQIEEFGGDLTMVDVGTVTEVGDGIARIHGLAGVQYTELLAFPGDVIGMAMNLEEDAVGAAIMGDDSQIKEGDEVRSTGRVAEVPVGDDLIGRTVDALGRPIDGKGPLTNGEHASHRARCAQRSDPPGSERAGANGYQSHRQHDPNRPRSARADHWRPLNRQERHSP